MNNYEQMILSELQGDTPRQKYEALKLQQKKLTDMSSDIIQHLQWNISSLRNSSTSRESVITLRVNEELLALILKDKSIKVNHLTKKHDENVELTQLVFRLFSLWEALAETGELSISGTFSESFKQIKKDVDKLICNCSSNYCDTNGCLNRKRFLTPTETELNEPQIII